MRRRAIVLYLVMFASSLFESGGVHAQAMPNPYGPPVTSEVARKAAAAALAEARRNGWTVATAVVDTGGTLVYFERIDGTQNGSSEIAQEKARTAAMFKRPSKAIEDVVAGGKLNYLRLSGTIPIEGGYPLLVEGKIIGAIGVSGGTSQQDGVCSKAGADAVAGAAPTPAPKK
jgi:glc operon protein GlcG